jgi:hypothetical protein
MTELREITREEFDRLVAARGGGVPIEQTSVWADYQSTIPGRTFWGCLAFSRDGADVAYVALMEYETHGYRFLRAGHGPIWLEAPTAEQEQEAMEAFASFMRKRDRRQVFARMAVDNDIAASEPTLSTVPYDTTVVIDLTGGEEAILSRMKPRGRRDVRKALREAPVTCADETARALESFDEYYAVMLETCARDGFAPAPQGDYENMIRILGEEHCRVFAGRLEDGTLATWSIVTLNGTRATKYYAASLNATMRNYVTDRLSFFECCSLADLGMRAYDLMGIGNDFAPSLMGLNLFKTKFSKEVAHVAPDRDVPIRRGFYRSLCVGKRVVDAARHRG